MAREYATGTISDVDIDQVIITVGQNEAGAQEVRVRANIGVTITNKLDPTDTYRLNLPINRTVQQLSVGPQVVAIRNAILAYAQTLA